MYAQTRCPLNPPLSVHFRLEAQQNWNGCIQILIASDWVSFLPSTDTKQIQPQLSQTHFRKFHNFKYSRKYQVCNNGNILDKYSIIENTLNFSWTHTNQLRSAVSLKILIWLPSHFKLGGFRRFTFTLNLNYLKIMLLWGGLVWSYKYSLWWYSSGYSLIAAEDDKKER